MQLTEQRNQQFERAKTNVIQRATAFFIEELDASLVQPLAARLGHNPAVLASLRAFNRVMDH